MRSSLPFCESMYGWFHLVMRDTVKVKCVCAHSHVFVSKRVMYVHNALLVCQFCCVDGWNGRSLECVCVFVCVYFRQSSPTVCPFSRDGLFMRHRHKKYQTGHCLPLKCLELSVLICHAEGDQSCMAAVWRSLISLFFFLQVEEQSY